MSYVDSELLPGEGIVWRGRGHWLAAFASPLGLLAFGVLLVANGAGLGWLLLLAGIALGGAAWLSWTNQDYAVTERRVIAKEGIIRRHVAELPLRAVESTQVTQSVMGRLLGYGSVVTAGTGGTRVRLQSVENPMGLRQSIQREIAAQHS